MQRGATARVGMLLAGMRTNQLAHSPFGLFQVQLIGRVAKPRPRYDGSNDDAKSALEAFLNRPLAATGMKTFADALAKRGVVTICDLARLGKVQFETIGLTEREILAIERLNFHLHGQRPDDIRPQH